MPEMKTALEHLKNVADNAWGCPTEIMTGEGNPACPEDNSTCPQCANNYFRAHVAGYAENYPEGES